MNTVCPGVRSSRLPPMVPEAGQQTVTAGLAWASPAALTHGVHGAKLEIRE
jgi:hypothetical protein